MKNFIKQLFCIHKFNYYMYNIKGEYGLNQTDDITIGFSNCRKCAKWKIQFIFGNKK